MSSAQLWSEFQKSKSEELRQQLILSYLWLVRYLAGRLAVRLPAAINQEDLESCGVLGLLEAIDKFDPALGKDFESYAYVRIRGAMLDELRRVNWIPRTIWQKLQALRAAREKLENHGEGVVTEEAVAREVGWEAAEVRRLEAHSRRIYAVSLDEMAATAGGETVRLGDAIPDESSPDPLDLVVEEDDRQLLVKAIESLNDKDRLVLSLHYQKGLTLKEIGKVLEVSESRVCQLHGRALSRLRKKLEELYREK
ncbi:MAG: FliA/WhiG family RNA polymerase sigma factor [Bacillota bacterium]